MRKPTVRQFFLGYACVFIAAQTFVVLHSPGGRMLPLSISMVNIVFVCINLIGTMFAMAGYAPWREADDPIERKRAPKSPPMTNTAPPQQSPIIVDSSEWTGRRR